MREDVSPADGDVRFGLFDWLDDNPLLGSTAEVYEARLRVLEYADRAGFWCYHLAEHHGTPLGMAPSPGVFLSAVAQRTRRIRLGPLVARLPLYDPVRLVQEICMLDHLSRGRLELGGGRGASPFELAMFGVRAEDTKQMYTESFEILLQGLTTGRMDFDGAFYRVKDATISLGPYQEPYPPLWYPTNNPASMPWIAREGFSLLFSSNLPPSTSVREQIGVYKDVWAANRHTPGRLNGHVGQPKYGPLRHILVADTDAEARRLARRAWARYHHSYNHLWALNGDRRHEHQRDIDALIEQKFAIVGSPETVRAGIQAYLDATACNYFAGCFTWGDLSTDETLRSLGLFVDAVRPRLRSAAREVALV